MNYLKKFPLLLITFTLMTMSSAEADWINISGAQNAPNIAEIYINDDHVRIALEIFVNDMVTFDRLIPEEFFAGTKIKRATLEERMQRKSASIHMPIRRGAIIKLF